MKKYFKIFGLILLLIWCCFSAYMLYTYNKTNINLNNILSDIDFYKKNYFQINSYNEAEAYKQMYENLKYSNDKILDTIYWSLGGLTTAIIALFGANIFFNFRFNKSEIENIKNNLNLKVEEIKNNTSQYIQSNINQLTDNSKNEITKLNQILEENHKNETHTLTSDFEKKYILLQKEIDKFKDILEDVKSQSRTKFNDFDKTYAKQFKSIMSLYYELDAQVWRLRDVEGNALSSFSKSALLDIETNLLNEFILNDVLDSLNKLFKLSQSNSTILQELLVKIPDEYTIFRDKISDKIKTLEIYSR